MRKVTNKNSQSDSSPTSLRVRLHLRFRTAVQKMNTVAHFVMTESKRSVFVKWQKAAEDQQHHHQIAHFDTHFEVTCVCEWGYCGDERTIRSQVQQCVARVAKVKKD